MGYFGSGDKNSTSADNRVGASDDAIVLQGGSFLFAPASKQPNATIGGSGGPNWTLIALSVVAVLGLAVFWRMNSK